MLSEFSWRRALLPALAPGAAMVGYFVWRSATSPLSTSPRFWLLVAAVVVADIALALGASFLRQTGRHVAASVVGVVTALVAIGCIVFAQTMTVVSPLTDAERAALVAEDDDGDGARRLRHPALGFSILDPGPGYVAAVVPYKPTAHFYSFIDRSAGTGLFVGLFKGQGDSPQSLRKLVESMARDAGVLAGTSGASVKVVRLDIPTSDPPQGELHAVINDRRHYRLKAHGWRSRDGAPFAIMIAVLAPSPDALTDVLASFRP